jgi:uncharacterized integral membrane protein
MRKFLTALVLIPLGLIFIIFAVANRHVVNVSFDPFNNDIQEGIRLPLFVVIISVAILGVLAGGIATWLGQHRWRRSSRRYQAEAIEARTQLADLRANIATASSREPQSRPLLLTQASGIKARERDKSGATL